MTHLKAILTAAPLIVGFLHLVPNAHADAEARSLVRAGEYEIMYFGQTVGRESFRIERIPSGYQITSTLRMNVGDQPSAESVYTLDEQRRFVAATYRPLHDTGLEAEYTRDSDTLRVTARQGGEVVGSQEIDIKPGAIITGPHYVTDFFVLAPLGYDIGDKNEIPAFAFGFKDWRVYDVEMECRREKNRDIDGPRVDDIDTEVYRCRIKTDDDTFKTRSFLNDAGVSVRITIERFIGYVDIRLREPENASG